jgi:hypothetical protein
MSHFWKFGVIAAVSLVLLTPSVSHAQSRDWDYDRIDALIEELESFENMFEDIVYFDDIEDHYDEVLVYLGDFEIPEQDVLIEPVRTSAKVTVMETASQSYGTFTITFDVTAVDNQIFIPIGLETESNGVPIKPHNSVGVEYSLLGEVFQPLTMNAVVTSTGRLSNEHYVVDEGETETFTLTVTVDPSKTGAFSMHLEGIYYTEGKDHLLFHEVDQMEDDFETREITIPGGTSLDIYRGYLNGSLFITTKGITEAAALANCTLNATNNPKASVRCTWGAKEIYRRDAAQVLPAAAQKTAPAPQVLPAATKPTTSTSVTPAKTAPAPQVLPAAPTKTNSVEQNTMLEANALSGFEKVLHSLWNIWSP